MVKIKYFCSKSSYNPVEAINELQGMVAEYLTNHPTRDGWFVSETRMICDSRGCLYTAYASVIPAEYRREKISK